MAQVRVTDSQATTGRAARARGAWASSPDVRLTDEEYNGIIEVTARRTVEEQPVITEFTATPDTGEAPLSVTFAATVTGTVVLTGIDFGEGEGIDVGPGPWVHEYATAGVYRATAYVLGTILEDSAEVEVTVNEPEPPPLSP